MITVTLTNVLTVKLLTLDVPNLNNRIYSTAVIEKAIKKLHGRPLLGTTGVTTGFEALSHVASNLRIVNNELFCDIAFLETPAGIELQRAQNIAYRTAGEGQIKHKGNNTFITDFTFISTTAVSQSIAA